MATLDTLQTEWKTGYLMSDYYDDKKANNKTGMTLQEIADLLGCTRERVRQIEAMALRKLRYKLRRRGINPDDLLPPSHEDDRF